MQQDYRVITGVAYPYLIKGKNRTDQITSNIHDRESYYYDEAVRLSEHDVQNMKNLVGHPLCVEHNEKINVGQITHSWTDKNGKLRFMARLNLKEQAGRMADEAMRSGRLKGVSVGYAPDIDFNTMKVRGKVFKEISLCRQGFFPGAGVTVHATSEDPQLAGAEYNSSGENIIYYKISAMSEEKNEVAIPQGEVEQKPISPPSSNGSDTSGSEASELARQTDEMLKKNEVLQKQLEEIKQAKERDAARLAEFEKQEQERQAKYQADKAEKLEKILEIQRQQYKDVHGEEAELPKEYEQSAAMAFKYEKAAPQMQAITASAMAYQKQKDQNADLMKRLAELEGKYKKLNDVNTVAMTHVAATRRRVFNSEEKESGNQEETTSSQVTASSSGGFDMLFVPEPSNEEIQLYQRDYGHYELNTGVTASDGTQTQEEKTYQAPPVHAHVEHVKNSMRFSAPNIFTHLIQFDPMNEPRVALRAQYEKL